MIKRAGVEEAIKNADIRALFNHDHTSFRAHRKVIVSLNVDDKGLYGDIIINRNDPDAMGACARVQRGDIVGQFWIYAYQSRYPLSVKMVLSDCARSLKSLVSPCTFPAYPQTEIATRKKDFECLKRANSEALNERKMKIKEKYNL